MGKQNVQAEKVYWLQSLLGVNSVKFLLTSYKKNVYTCSFQLRYLLETCLTTQLKKPLESFLKAVEWILWMLELLGEMDNPVGKNRWARMVENDVVMDTIYAIILLWSLKFPGHQQGLNLWVQNAGCIEITTLVHAIVASELSTWVGVVLSYPRQIITQKK